MSLAAWASKHASDAELPGDHKLKVTEEAVALDQIIQQQMKSLNEAHEKVNNAINPVAAQVVAAASAKTANVGILDEIVSICAKSSESALTEIALQESAKARLAQMVSFYKVVDGVRVQERNLNQELFRKRQALLLASAASETGSKRARVQAAEKAGRQVPKEYVGGGVRRCHECEWELAGCECKKKLSDTERRAMLNEQLGL